MKSPMFRRLRNPIHFPVDLLDHFSWVWSTSRSVKEETGRWWLRKNTASRNCMKSNVLLAKVSGNVLGQNCIVFLFAMPRKRKRVKDQTNKSHSSDGSAKKLKSEHVPKRQIKILNIDDYIPGKPLHFDRDEANTNYFRNEAPITRLIDDLLVRKSLMSTKSRKLQFLIAIFLQISIIKLLPIQSWPRCLLVCKKWYNTARYAEEIFCNLDMMYVAKYADLVVPKFQQISHFDFESIYFLCGIWAKSNSPLIVYWYSFFKIDLSTRYWIWSQSNTWWMMTI